MLSRLYYHLLSTDKPRQNIHFSINDLEAFTELTTGQQKLLVAMMRKVKTDHKYNSIVTEAKYADLGYSKRQNFHSDKRALEKAGWIITEGKQYVICLHKVMCVTKKYYENIMIYFGLKIGIVMGQRFKPDLPPIPKPRKQ